jgi:uncharacterized protein (TIGR02246 family)
MSRWAAGAALLILSGPGPAAADELREAIDAGNRAFVEAFLRGDADAVANLYTEQAQVIPPGAEVVKGRAAIAAYWRSFIETGVKDLALSTQDLESAGNLACEVGTVRIVGVDGNASLARYVVVWKHEGGKWLLHRDIWNSGAAVATAAAPSASLR